MTEKTTTLVGRNPSAIAFDGTNIWVANTGSSSVTKLLASTGAVVGEYPAGISPVALSFDGTNIWVVSGGEVIKLLARTGAVIGKYPYNPRVDHQPAQRSIASDGTNVWVSNCRHRSVTKLLASTGAVVGEYPTGDRPRAIASDGTNIWVANEFDGSVTKLLASSGAVVGTYPVGESSGDLAFDGTNIWVAGIGRGIVTKLLASTGAVVGEYPAGISPGAIAFDGANIWVADQSRGILTKLLARTGAVVGTVDGISSPTAMTFDGTNIWVVNYDGNSVTKIPSPQVHDTSIKQIEHVVLLMMENRSFDSLLGWLYEKAAPAKNVPALKAQERSYHGLQGLNLQDYENVDATGTIKVKPIKGAKGLNVPNVAPGENFTQVTTQLFEWPFEMTFAPPIQMTPGGVLVAGKWRTHDEVKTMSAADMRNALVIELSKHTNQSQAYFGQFTDSRAKDGPPDKDLPGKGAVVVFLRDAGIRDVAALKNMSDDDQRNTLIVENNKHTGTPVPELQGMTNQELVLMAWTRFKKPTMKGYVRDYANELRHLGYDEEHVKRYAEQVMQSYTPDQLPVLNGLAEHYAVGDMWFSSVPSQTNPNRAFAMCGTSMGLVNNGFLEKDPRAVTVEEKAGYLIGDDRFEAKAIFNALEDAKATWKIFRQSGYLQDNIYKAVDAFAAAAGAAGGIGAVTAGLGPLGPLVALGAIIVGAVGYESARYLKELSSSEVISDYTHRLFPEILKIANADVHFAKLDEFHRLARAGQLPNFSYLQPEWTIGHTGTGGGLGTQMGIKSVLFHQGRDYHPPGNLDAAENLIKEVYTSLIANRKAWEKTLLIITFDEPIGSFDHVPPPAAVPPWGNEKAPVKREYNFDFKRYGARVPAILVSPLVEKGVVFRSSSDVPFDHTSIIATTLKWRKLESRIPEFGERTKQAPTFENVVSLRVPRTDEKEVRFYKSHKAGEPVRYYDRFYLRDFAGRYVAGFKEHGVFPGSIVSTDPTISEYFPTLESLEPGAPHTAFYFQNANPDNRPDAGPITADGKTKVRLVATDVGLGSYNVLGSWQDSRDVYYFNDYMEGDEGERESWRLIKTDNSSLHFGDKVLIQNAFPFSVVLGGSDQRLIPCYDHPGYLTTIKSGHGCSPASGYRIYPEAEYYWTVEPIFDETPGPDSITLGSECYLKHATTGRYLTQVDKRWNAWYPTLGGSNRIKVTIRGAGVSTAEGSPLVDGRPVEIVSAKEDLNWSGSRYDLVMAARTDPYLYYYYKNSDYQDNETWIISVVAGSGLVKGGSRVRFFNQKFLQFMVPKDSWLTTVEGYSADCDWVLEKAAL